MSKAVFVKDSVLLYDGSGYDEIQPLVVSHQRSLGHMQYGYAQTRNGAVEVARKVGQSVWRIINPVGRHHSPSDFSKGEIVWVSLASHLYKAKIKAVPRSNSLKLEYSVLFLDEDGSVSGGSSASLEQLVKFGDWSYGGDACPYPRFDMLPE